ncbi:MAG: N-acetylmuramic acid 6-phosphate etherase [Microbacterium sp.]
MRDATRPTEARNPRTIDIDLWESERIVRALLAEDERGIRAAAAVAGRLAAAVDEAGLRLADGGTVHAFGAGASGRLAVLDATEATPTFGAPRGLFTAHFPGGAEAFADSSIDFEDAERLGREDADAVSAGDVALGITASGATAYVAGALARSGERGALTILVCCDPEPELGPLADHVIAADTGAEAITGSTRLKAGTATKALLNAFSTALMVRQGRTYSNLMVDLVVTNSKLDARATAIVATAAGVAEGEARRALSEAGGAVPVAILRAMTGADPDRCARALEPGGGIRRALRRMEESA